MADEQEILNRWRLVLGKYASGQISFSGGGLNYMDMENVLDYLYSREYGEEQEIRKDRQGGSDGSQLTVPPGEEAVPEADGGGPGAPRPGKIRHDGTSHGPRGTAEVGAE